MTAEFSLIAETLRRCPRCKAETPLSEWSGGYCIPCRRLNAREAYARNRKHQQDTVYAKSIMRLYSMTMDQYEAMRAAQDGRCAICGESSSRRLTVDHDHKTGAVRALLCAHCNLVLGNARDSIDVLESAIQYLRAHGVSGDGSGG